MHCIVCTPSLKQTLWDCLSNSRSSKGAEKAFETAHLVQVCILA